jgi:hypothetical protein
MVFVRAILAAAVCVALSTASPLVKRQALVKDPCRHENLFVGGTVVGDSYIEKVDTEADCIQKCHDLSDCQAVNYFPKHKACLPQIEPFQGEFVDRLATLPIDNTVYVIVKGCQGDSQNPENNRKKRQVADLSEESEESSESSESEESSESQESSESESESQSSESSQQPEETPEDDQNAPTGGDDAPAAGRRKRQVSCRSENLRVGGTVSEQLEHVETEKECVKACEERDDCQAVNYFPQHQICWPQQESLLTDAKSLSTVEDELTNYIIVKGCGGHSTTEQPEEGEEATEAPGEDDEATEDPQGSEETSDTTEDPEEGEEATEGPKEDDDGDSDDISPPVGPGYSGPNPGLSEEVLNG